MAKKEIKELSNNEHNDKVFVEITKLENQIAELKSTLKPVENVKYATLAECNALAKKQKAK